jgi:hypothetical protein
MIPLPKQYATRSRRVLLIRFDQLGGESTVEMISKRQTNFLFFQTEDRHLGEQASNRFFVFFWLETACAVNEHAIRFQEWQDAANNRDLPFLHPVKIRPA